VNSSSSSVAEDDREEREEREDSEEEESERSRLREEGVTVEACEEEAVRGGVSSRLGGVVDNFVVSVSVSLVTKP